MMRESPSAMGGWRTRSVPMELQTGAASLVDRYQASVLILQTILRRCVGRIYFTDHVTAARSRGTSHEAVYRIEKDVRHRSDS